MEVHHHPHTTHKPKPWKEYLLEGLMIFVAVTLGFFAEGIREHLGDRSKEREYMSQLLDDLKEDMKECGVNNDRSIITLNNKIGKSCDTLIHLLSETHPPREDVCKAYLLYHRILSTWFAAYFKDATWSQLRYNGGFRLIENINVVRQVNDYYKWISELNDYIDELKGRYYAINNNEGRKVFDSRFILAMLDSINAHPIVPVIFGPSEKLTHFIDPGVEIKFLHSDAETIAVLCNDIRFYKTLLMLYDGMVITQGKRAVALVQLIEKEQYPVSE
jgi:hypothetical protein